MHGAVFINVTMENIQASGLLLAWKLTEVTLGEHRYYITAYSLEVIDGLHLGPRALQSAALTFNADGLGSQAYY